MNEDFTTIDVPHQLYIEICIGSWKNKLKFEDTDGDFINSQVSK
jgi:hypothetical protein